MKKRMRIAAMLAGAMMLCSAIPAAPVSALYCWGTADGKEFADMQQVDDKGMFKKNSTVMLLSAGIGKLRLFDPPEILLLDIDPAF